MMTEDGTPHLSDVGLNARLVKVIYGDRRPVPPRWMFKAPEELLFNYDPLFFTSTAEMDVYAFAATAYTIYTMTPPFASHTYGRGIMQIVAHGHVLAKPGEIPEPLWNLLERCWSYDPSNRPSMATVVADLKIIQANLLIESYTSHISYADCQADCSINERMAECSM